jgi:hypothetical protein
MGFRRSVSQDELRAGQPAEQRGQHETVYQASRGGHFPQGQRPVPGTPQDDDDS